MTGMHRVYGKLDPAQEKQPVHVFSPGATINDMNDQICMTGQASNIQICMNDRPKSSGHRQLRTGKARAQVPMQKTAT